MSADNIEVLLAEQAASTDATTSTTTSTHGTDCRCLGLDRRCGEVVRREQIEASRREIMARSENA